MGSTVSLGLTGDVMLGRGVDRRQRRRPVTAVWGDVEERLRDLDGLLINLECCLSTRGHPWTLTHHPYHFRADPDWAVPALQAVEVDYCSLANNHSLDYDRPALLDTLDALDDAEIARSGAGENETAARTPATFDVDPLTVAVVAFTDNTPEFAARPRRAGTAHVKFKMDRRNRRVVRSALNEARDADPDLLVASLHWGPNLRTKPPKRFRRFARWLADEGVDIVHGHSAHVFQGVEVVDGTLVCYDCGDFVDDYAVDRTLRNDRSFLFEVTCDDDGPTELRLVPVEIDDFAVHEASAEAAEWCRETMRRRSKRFETTFEEEDGELVVAIE